MELPISARLDEVAARRPNHPALIDPDGTITTHGQLAERSRKASAGLVELGLRRGDSIGIFEPNRSVWIELWAGAAWTGINVVGLNTRFRTAELDHLLAVAEVDLVLTPDRFLAVDPPSLFRQLARSPRLIVDGDATDFDGLDARSWEAFLDGAAALDSPAQSSPAVLGELTIGFTTSGTTGFPKIACHTQQSTLHHAGAVISAYDLDSDSVALVALPLCGTFGFASALPVLLAGGTVVLHDTWDPSAAARAISEYGVTFCNGADTMILDTIESPDFDTDTTWTTGVFADFANAGIECVRRAEERTNGRLRLTGTYGSSEGFALMCRWDPSASIDERSRNGGPLIGADYLVRVCDPETGVVQPHGDPGEIQFRGANLIHDYLANPEATTAAFTSDGWFRTGDLGHTIDSRTFIYLARLGDSLRLRGFLCDPSEIEHQLETHPGVELAQVVGVDRVGVGDVAIAFVRPSPGAAPDLAEPDLMDHCRQGLANYKQPERIVIVDEFPVTDGPNGVKIRKVELRDRAAALLLDRDSPARQMPQK